MYFLIGKFLREDAEKLRRELHLGPGEEKEHSLLKKVWGARKEVVDAMNMLSQFEAKPNPTLQSTYEGNVAEEKVRIG